MFGPFKVSRRVIEASVGFDTRSGDCWQVADRQWFFHDYALGRPEGRPHEGF